MIDPAAIDETTLAQAADAIMRGDVVAYPTETFYGLAADPRNAEAIERVFAAKGRRSDEPLPLIASDLDTVQRWFGALTPRAARLARQFWPGPLTLVVPLPLSRSLPSPPLPSLGEDAALAIEASLAGELAYGGEVALTPLPSNLTAGRANIAVRVPAHPLARALAAAAGGVITSTSANLSGQPPVSTADDVLRTIGPRIAIVIDGGATPGGAPSTIVDVSDAQPRLVRAGSVPWERVLESLE